MNGSLSKGLDVFVVACAHWLVYIFHRETRCTINQDLIDLGKHHRQTENKNDKEIFLMGCLILKWPVNNNWETLRIPCSYRLCPAHNTQLTANVDFQHCLETTHIGLLTSKIVCKHHL